MSYKAYSSCKHKDKKEKIVLSKSVEIHLTIFLIVYTIQKIMYKNYNGGVVLDYRVFTSCLITAPLTLYSCEFETSLVTFCCHRAKPAGQLFLPVCRIVTVLCWY